MPKKLKKRQIARNNNISLDLSLPKTLKNAVIKKDFKSVRRLLKNEANPNEQDVDGSTPLHLAVKENELLIASLLLQNGAYLMVKNNLGYTPLDYAVILNFFPLIKLLEEKHNNILNVKKDIDSKFFLPNEINNNITNKANFFKVLNDYEKIIEIEIDPIFVKSGQKINF